MVSPDSKPACPRWRLAFGMVALAVGCHAPPTRPKSARLAETRWDLSPCVPEIRSTHLAVTGSVGGYRVSVLELALSPDDATLAIARSDGVVQINDLVSRTVRCIPGVFAFALSSDARWAAGVIASEHSWHWQNSGTRSRDCTAREN